MLIADDYIVSRKAYEALMFVYLKMPESQVIICRDGEDALNMIKEKSVTKNAFALLLLDFNMPFYSGVQVVEHAKAYYREKGFETFPDVAMVSAHIPPKERHKLKLMGVTKIIDKPAKPSLIQNLLIQNNILKPKSDSNKSSK